MAHRFYMVDVFAQQPYCGNPLAVVAGAQPLPDKTMQRIAAEMNFSETAFVASVPEDNGGYRVRIFTPAREIAFAGHPILGTALIVRRYVASASCAQVQLNLAASPVSVTFEPVADEREVIWFRAPSMSFGATADHKQVATALGLSEEDISTAMPIQVVSAGTSALIVPLCSLDALRRSSLDLEAFAPLAAKGFPPLTYLFCWQTHQPENDLCVRFFFEAHGVREDPATGNAAAFLGTYLLQHQSPPQPILHMRIEQGHEVGRPSLVLLRARNMDGIHEVSVGGYVIPTVQGELLI